MKKTRQIELRLTTRLWKTVQQLIAGTTLTEQQGLRALEYLRSCDLVEYRRQGKVYQYRWTEKGWLRRKAELASPGVKRKPLKTFMREQEMKDVRPVRTLSPDEIRAENMKMAQDSRDDAPFTVKRNPTPERSNANDDRKAAIKEGRATYVGKPCKNGHTVRYTSSYQCVECFTAFSAGVTGRKDDDVIVTVAQKLPPEPTIKKQGIEVVLTSKETDLTVDGKTITITPSNVAQVMAEIKKIHTYYK